MGPSRKRTMKVAWVLVCGAALAPTAGVRAQSDMEMQERALKAREQAQSAEMDHSAHAAGQDQGRFRGVFYGYLPCDEEDCNGLKMTLSLNQKHKYLLVLQPAKPQNRESYEKGTYRWDDAQNLVILTPRNDAPPRRLAIKDEGTLLYLTGDGKSLSGDQDRYLLKRSDQAGNRAMHIH